MQENSTLIKQQRASYIKSSISDIEDENLLKHKIQVQFFKYKNSSTMRK